MHLTEKATTSKGIGTLAENLLNNLVADEHVYSKVIETRNETHTKQVHLAQVYQEKSLAELGITIFNGKVCSCIVYSIHFSECLLFCYYQMVLLLEGA